MEVFKILKGYEGVEEQLFFSRHISNTRGHSKKLYKDRVNRDELKYSFANRGIGQWNRLPEEVISANSINTLKNKVYLKKEIEGLNEYNSIPVFNLTIIIPTIIVKSV